MSGKNVTVYTCVHWRKKLFSLTINMNVHMDTVERPHFNMFFVKQGLYFKEDSTVLQIQYKQHISICFEYEHN